MADVSDVSPFKKKHTKTTKKEEKKSCMRCIIAEKTIALVMKRGSARVRG